MNEPVLARAPAAPVPPPQRRRSKWPRRLLILLAVGLAVVTSLALVAGSMHFAVPVHMTINGHEVFQGFDFDAMPPAQRGVLAGVVLISLLAALVVVPVALLFGALAIAMVALMVVSLPLVVVASAVVLLLSPLILFAWLLWRLARS